MITITYDSIPVLVTAFARLPNDAERLAWVASHIDGAGDPRAAAWVLEEYWRHPEIWTAIQQTIWRGGNGGNAEVANDRTLWAAYDPAIGQRQDGMPFVEWLPKGGARKVFRDDRKFWHIERIQALPPLEPIPGVSRGWFPRSGRGSPECGSLASRSTSSQRGLVDSSGRRPGRRPHAITSVAVG